MDVPTELLEGSSIGHDFHPPKSAQRIQLADLPFELLESIFINLRTSTILSVALTCRALHPAALSCLHSTITIAPSTAIPTGLPQSRRFSPDPFTLATRLLADPSLGPRIRHFTFSTTSTLTLNPRRTLPGPGPGPGPGTTSWSIRSRHPSPALLHPLTASITHATRTGLLSAPHRAARLHGLASGAAQHLAAACLSRTPRLRSLDLAWAGTGVFVGAAWLRDALPLLEAFTLRVPGTRGRRGRRGWGGGEEWRVPEWAVRGAVAAGHARLRVVSAAPLAAACAWP
ncbi:hypothetical protein GTA08_BOTSDO08057 [Neofusicoccum parvum]|uniref:Uncharacterized protein n=1 Tax=Neofusicoccum parvum TaxID=310453 RepID=A0ACB5RS70_9PEZI|nr:hypothetical protein GTA08_BOTSDO08057 [Neofusicoccum parvum]